MVDVYSKAVPGPGGQAAAAQGHRTIASVHAVWGAFLFLCAKASAAELILELRSCSRVSAPKTSRRLQV